MKFYLVRTPVCLWIKTRPWDELFLVYSCWPPSRSALILGSTIIIASSIISTYYVDKRRIISKSYPNFALQPLIFHETYMTPWAIFPNENWQRRTHSAFLVAVFLPIPCLEYWPNTISSKLPVKEKSGVHLYTQSWWFGWRLKNENILCHEKNLYKP